MVELTELLHPSQAEIDARNEAVEAVTQAVTSIWPSASVAIFGSFATGEGREHDYQPRVGRRQAMIHGQWFSRLGAFLRPIIRQRMGWVEAGFNPRLGIYTRHSSAESDWNGMRRMNSLGRELSVWQLYKLCMGEEIGGCLPVGWEKGLSDFFQGPPVSFIFSSQTRSLSSVAGLGKSVFVYGAVSMASSVHASLDPAHIYHHCV